MSRSARTMIEDIAGRRDDDRIAVGRTCILRVADRATHSALLDLTRLGCRIRTSERLRIDQPVHLGLAGVGTVEALVMWGDGDTYGCEFIGSLHPGAVSDATRGNVVSFDAAPVAQPFKWSPRIRLAILAAYAATPWLVIVAAVYVLTMH